ncbi:MAG TPA: hypothetical protein VGF08_06240, partial [Terriglobales bacterium]
VRYNISQNDHNRGINIAGPVANSQIYNNTIYVGKGDKVSLLLHSDWEGWASGTYLYNNIFYVEGEAEFASGASRDPDTGHHITAPGFGSSTGNVFDSNLYFGHLAAAPDAHGRTSDPLLAAPGSGGMGRETLSGYQLQSGSPAADSGKSIHTQGGNDFFGARVPACGGMDRGAAEQQTCSAGK